jgi:CRP-like cAMP-binding protein
VPYFANLDDSIIEELQYTLKQEFFEDGSYLFKAGDPCRKMFIIGEGEVEILVRTNHKS